MNADSGARRERVWFRAGAVLQGAVLGIGLFLALVSLLRLASGAQVFRYQGF